MQLLARFVLILSLTALLSCKQVSTQTTNSNRTDSNPTHSKPTHNQLNVAFGSCNKHWEESQPIWKQVVKNEADLWIWLGDIIYADTDDLSKMRDDYTTQKSHADYNILIANTDVIGIWDDHDYGTNDGGKNYRQKEESRELLFDFLDVPLDSPDRKHKGAYQTYTYVNDDLVAKVILLDVRYFRDDNGSDGTILGEEQWSWLVSNLENSKADVHIIGGGIQFLPEEHKYEKWANFPKEKKRLIDIIDKLDVSNPILLSGDRHLAEMSLVPLGESSKPLLEITSSGLTHSYRKFKSEKNRHRIGSVVPTKNFGLLKIEKKNNEVTFIAEIRNDMNQLQYSVSSDELSTLLKLK